MTAVAVAVAPAPPPRRSIAEYRVNEERIRRADARSLVARWRCGRWLLAERHEAKRLPDGRLTELTAALGCSRRELQYRMAFATQYRSEELRNVLRSCPSWHDVVMSFADAGAGGSLVERYVVPPFSVLDARQGYWQDRKRRWRARGIHGEEGRGDDLVYGDSLLALRPGMQTQSANIDPVLCEVVYRWFTPGPCRVLDPFAGEATKGLVAAKLGHTYVGVELRPEQVEANEKQAVAMGVAPRWICGDSAKLTDHLAGEEPFDLLWTSPPYYDLERYGGGPDDGSGLGNYDAFVGWLHGVFRQAVALLRPNCFAVVKVGEIRDPTTGDCRGFVRDTIDCFTRLGLHFRDEAILLTPVGSLPVRAAAPFAASRTLGRGHQYVTVFFKGDPKAIRDRYPPDPWGAA